MVGKICKCQKGELGLVLKTWIGVSGCTNCTGINLTDGGKWQSSYPMVIYNSLNDYIEAKIEKAINQHKCINN